MLGTRGVQSDESSPRDGAAILEALDAASRDRCLSKSPTTGGTTCWEVSDESARRYCRRPVVAPSISFSSNPHRG
ncbi:unnamed protein product [Chondrus crispus]|uniref:Uncharacterized protein n=1 Tax=Chondrus crispus TaxID=2769 RepID=R7Q7S4_CHOCR|nr:unnamed protein product [Chondrus crispus]CDF34592.1 unnamed protein product [Chondrus crispus]|eukprot:XP_005714411.1 unnamed protein product [Chondrus crispus]